MNKSSRASSFFARLNETLPVDICQSNRGNFIVAVFIAFFTCNVVAASSEIAQSRGELLYTTHCISCHTTEIHWRDKHSAINLTAVVTQVRRWQSAASLSWSEGDILDVSRYLNETIYHFEQTTNPVSSSSQEGNDAVSALPPFALLLRP